MRKCICPDCNCNDTSQCSEDPCFCCHLDEATGKLDNQMEKQS